MTAGGIPAPAPAGPPDQTWAEQVCLLGHGEATCRYLSLGRSSWSCEKGTTIGAHVDERVRLGTIMARGDNCAGRDQSGPK